MSDPYLDAFFVAWGILDVVFTFVEQLFVLLFRSIPGQVIPLVIAIFFYGIFEMMDFILKKTRAQDLYIVGRVYYSLITLFTFLFTIWRFGIIMLLDTMQSTFALGFGNVLLNMLYILVAFALYYCFKQKVAWLKLGLYLFTWTALLLLVFIIVPATFYFHAQKRILVPGDYYSYNTVIEVVGLATFFIIPFLLNRTTADLKGSVFYLHSTG